MPGFTNRGKANMLAQRFRGVALPTNFFVALCTSAATPTPDTDTFGQLTEITAGNGYTAGGISLSRNTTDFDTLTEDDVNDRALVQIRDLVWTAAGGNLPASGGGARWAVLTDDNATPANRDVDQYFDLVSDRQVTDTQTLTLQNCEIRLNET